MLGLQISILYLPLLSSYSASPKLQKSIPLQVHDILANLPFGVENYLVTAKQIVCSLVTLKNGIGTECLFRVVFFSSEIAIFKIVLIYYLLSTTLLSTMNLNGHSRLTLTMRLILSFYLFLTLGLV
jgi:hypothetical protein